MVVPLSGVLNTERRSNWVRLRTLIVLRWIAIAGQLAAIVVAQRLFNLNLDLGLCLFAIGASIIANLVAIFVYPETRRLSESEVTAMLLFDIAQLSSLLFLTGGLHNPFALLILAPITISATALRTGSTVLVGAVTILLITIVSVYHIPLRTHQGIVMQMPDVFVFGFWVAIVIGVIFVGAYARRVASEVSSMSEALLATQMALAREQQISQLSGVVAAAAHELGTPLATIKLASSELMEELSGQPALFDDAVLIRDQADRCRDILRSMGQAGKGDRQLEYAPLTVVIQAAADPHMDRGKTVVFGPGDWTRPNSAQPEILRRPEILHGLRNLIQNAVDFSTTTVWIDAFWNKDTVTVRIIDDGPGFPLHVKSRIGDPFVRYRRLAADKQQRPEYEGMGLGLFIAKTLLERSGAELMFANGSNTPATNPHAATRSGAIVEVVWPMDMLRPDVLASRQPLGENQNFPI